LRIARPNCELAPATQPVERDLRARSAHACRVSGMSALGEAAPPLPLHLGTCYFSETS